MEISELLNKLKLTDIDDVDEEGNTALHLTIVDETLTQKETIEAIEVLINEGIDPDTKNYYNESALNMAVVYRLKNVVDYLIARNSNTDLVAHFFIRCEHSTFSKWLSQNDKSDAWNIRTLNIEKESASFVEWLILRGFDFDCKNQENQSAFQIAIALNLKHILPVLLKYTKDINSVDEDNQTLLHFFLRENYNLGYESIKKNWYSERYTVDIVKTLLDRGLSADAEDKYKCTPIRIAIQEEKDIVVIDLLLESSAGIHRKHKKVETILQMAMNYLSCSGESKIDYHLKVLNSLIAKGADINELYEADEYGYTPLCIVVRFLNIHAINFLQDNGADFNVITEDGENLLHLLIRNYCSKKTDGNKELILIDLLISKGCQVNDKDKLGNTPLHDAVTYYDNVAIAQKLIEHGAEVNCKRNDGMTPLHIATLTKSNVDLVNLLRRNGADFNVAMEDGKTIIHLFAMQRNGCNALFKSIINGGCQVNVKDATGSSPIHLAAMHADSKVVQMLIECGADVNCRNNKRETPLHVLTKNPKYSEVNNIAELLLKHGANVDAKDSKSRSALHTVALESRSEHQLFGTLVNHGADINARDASGLSVLCCIRIGDSRDHEKRCREYVQKHNESLLEKYNRERNDTNDAEDCPPEQMTIADCPLEKEASNELQFFTGQALKLKAINLPRSEIIDSWLVEVFKFTGIWKCYERFYGQYLKEIEKLKSRLIDEHTSLYAWLRMDLKSRCAYVNNQILKDIAHPSTFELQLQKISWKYSNSISAKYREAVTPKALLEPAKEAWMQLTKDALLDLCVECIFFFLSNTDLFNIIEAE